MASLATSVSCIPRAAPIDEKLRRKQEDEEPMAMANSGG